MTRTDKVMVGFIAGSMLYLAFHLFAWYLRTKYGVDILEPLP